MGIAFEPRVGLPRTDALNRRAAVALGRLLEHLKAHGYRFITPTPETHARIVARPERQLARNVTDVLGWNIPFQSGVLDPDLEGLLNEAEMLVQDCGALRSAVRVSSLGDDLYLHSGYPPTRESVFFGPDSYRFARFLTDKLGLSNEVRVLVDLGAGSGVGAVVAARQLSPAQVILTDISPRALDFARLNLACAGVQAEFRCGSGLSRVTEAPDLVIANPPFIAGAGGRIYSDGGDLHGARISLDWARSSALRLRPGGRMLLYTGVAIIDGLDPLLSALQDQLDDRCFTLEYEEIDPDIFGETLDLDAYRDVDRIAAVAAVITRQLM